MNALPAPSTPSSLKRKEPNASVANAAANAATASANRRKRYARTKNVNVVWRANPETGEAEMLRFSKMGSPSASLLPASLTAPASSASPAPSASLPASLPASLLTPPPRRMLTRGTPVGLSPSPLPSNDSSIPESATPVRLSFPPMSGQGRRKSRKSHKGKKARKAGRKSHNGKKAH